MQKKNMPWNKATVKRVYISLGHELIHAYHNAKGENKGMYVYGVYSSRKEEYTTKFDPELSENTLRLENGLNKRYK